MLQLDSPGKPPLALGPSRSHASDLAHPTTTTRAERIVVVGTYPPTECGLATYTANISAAIASAAAHKNTRSTVGVIRLVDPDDHPSTAREVVAHWPRQSARGLEAALNATIGADAVVVQHEFGIFPGRDGDAILAFARRCPAPVVSELHTVLASPSDHQRAIVEQLAAMSLLVVVHSAVAKERLVAAHQLDAAHVAIVPHGAVVNLAGPPERIADEPIMLTWGLLGPGKGIEHGIEAVALLRGAGIEVRYIVAGGTHPKVRARDGERYRDGLARLAARRGVDDLIEFDDEYRTWNSLRALVRSAAVVLLPYDTYDQVTSGVLVEALASGKPVVATAFPHAVELSQTGAVRVVSHRDPVSCALAIRRILTEPKRRAAMEEAARAIGAQHDWSIVGEQFHQLIATSIGSTNGSATAMRSAS